MLFEFFYLVRSSNHFQDCFDKELDFNWSKIILAAAWNFQTLVIIHRKVFLLYISRICFCNFLLAYSWGFLNNQNIAGLCFAFFNYYFISRGVLGLLGCWFWGFLSQTSFIFPTEGFFQNFYEGSLSKIIRIWITVWVSLKIL